MGECCLFASTVSSPLIDSCFIISDNDKHIIHTVHGVDTVINSAQVEELV